MNNHLSISIVVPVLNEADSLKIFYNELKKVLYRYTEYEIIFIDDGSDDGSNKIIRELAENDTCITMIRLFKNYGKADALSEGFKYVEGDIVITIDSDLQDDPAEIPYLIEKIQEGWDVVSGWKKDRQDPLTKRIPSILFNFVTRLLTGINIHDFNCGLKAYRKKVVKAVDLYGGMHRYIPALAGKKGFSITEVKVNHRPREYGVTKYGGNRFFHGFFDLFTMLFTSRYFDRPLHFFGSVGLIFLLIGFGCEVFPLYDKLANGIPFQKHFALIVFGAMVFVLGLWFFSIGLLGELFIKSSGSSDIKVHSIYSSNQS
jgi:glycosyltransferase involved in cell wall biosynthesis